MEYHPEPNRHLRDQKSFGTSAKNTLVDLQDGLKEEKRNLSYADLHHEIARNAKDVSPKSSANHQNQRIGRKGNKEDEIVKYMSKLPNFLENGKNPQETVLNFGVLDWGRLEKWQFSHKQMSHSGGRSSLSSSDLASSFSPSSFSTDASASQSSGGYISSPPHQRICRPSLQFHLTSSPDEAYPRVVKFFGQNLDKFQDLKDAQNNMLNNRGNYISTEKSFGKAHQETKLEEKGKDSDPKISQEGGTLPNGVKFEVASTTKVKLKTRDGQYVKRTDKRQEGNPDVADHVFLGKQETVVHHFPTNSPQNNVSRASNLSDFTMALGQQPAETMRRSFLERSKDTDLLCKVDNNKYLQMKQTSFIDAKNVNSSKTSQSVPHSAKIGICPSGGGNLEEKISTTTINKSITNEPFMGLDLRSSKVAAEKVRSTSPFRRLSFSMGKIGKSSGSEEVSALPQLNTTYVSTHSGSENAVVSSSLDTSSDKVNATSRARSSPLRRLLDPILKSRPTNCRNNSEPFPRHSISKDRASKSSDGRSHSSTVASHLEKVKLDMTSCRTINVNDSLQEKKHGSQAVQALLHVAVKNGQPLFTFAVDKESDILAATLKKLNTSRKEDYSCMYTFFTIQEVKRKNGRWLNHGSKRQIHDCIPNVVAQMKVRGSCSSNLIKDNYVDHFSMREFVLSSVELRQAVEQTSDLQPSEELAAIVVKIPMRISRSSLVDGYQGDVLKDHPEVRLKDFFPVVPFDSNPGTNIQNCRSIISRDMGAIVILPSGFHALPPTGEPSSLIQRWRSGGSCDCGGWDLGCKLRILANRNQLIRKAGSSKACSTSNHFELFYQEGVLDNRPFFRLAPFKDGIYTVEFNSTLSLLQAFSICISVLDSRKACESESSNLFEEKASVDTVLVQNDEKDS